MQDAGDEMAWLEGDLFDFDDFGGIVTLRMIGSFICCVGMTMLRMLIHIDEFSFSDLTESAESLPGSTESDPTQFG